MDTSPHRHPPQRFLFLLLSLLTLILLYPFVYHLQFGNWFLDTLDTVLLLAAIRVVRRRRAQLIVATIIAIPTIAVNWLNDFYPLTPLLVCGNVMYALFFMHTLVVILTNVLTTQRVTWDKVFGATCAYLLIGLIWGNIYSAIDTISPGAFRNIGGPADVAGTSATASQLNELEYCYFSFTTLTTLGFGDIVPVLPVVRVVTALEAICGQLFLTILVSRLVGLHIAHSMSVREDQAKS